MNIEQKSTIINSLRRKFNDLINDSSCFDINNEIKCTFSKNELLILLDVLSSLENHKNKNILCEQSPLHGPWNLKGPAPDVYLKNKPEHDDNYNI